MADIPFQADSFVQFPTGRVSLEDVHAIFKTINMVDYRMKLAARLVVNKKRHSA